MVSATGRCRFVRDKNKQHAKLTSTCLRDFYVRSMAQIFAIFDKARNLDANFVNKTGEILDTSRCIVHYLKNTH